MGTGQTLISSVYYDLTLCALVLYCARNYLLFTIDQYVNQRVHRDQFIHRRARFLSASNASRIYCESTGTTEFENMRIASCFSFICFAVPTVPALHNLHVRSLSIVLIVAEWESALRIGHHRQNDLYMNFINRINVRLRAVRRSLTFYKQTFQCICSARSRVEPHAGVHVHVFAVQT